MSTCFFIGHREAPDSLLPQLSAEIERHITVSVFPENFNSHKAFIFTLLMALAMR